MSIYTYQVEVISTKNTRVTLTVKASTSFEALFKAGAQFDRIRYNVGDTSTMQEMQLHGTIIREGIGYLNVLAVDTFQCV